MREKSLKLLEDLTTAHGAPGNETAVRAIFRRELGDELITDRTGSIASVKGDTGPRVMVAGHMDEVGFMVQSITSNGLLRIVNLGGWWGHVLLLEGR